MKIQGAGDVEAEDSSFGGSFSAVGSGDYEDNSGNSWSK